MSPCGCGLIDAVEARWRGCSGWPLWEHSPLRWKWATRLYAQGGAGAGPWTCIVLLAALPLLCWQAWCWAIIPRMGNLLHVMQWSRFCPCCGGCCCFMLSLRLPLLPCATGASAAAAFASAAFVPAFDTVLPLPLSLLRRCSSRLRAARCWGRSQPGTPPGSGATWGYPVLT